MFEYGVGDRVLVQFDSIKQPATVEDVVPSGGGQRGKDPLYWVEFDSPVNPASTARMVSLTNDYMHCRFHSCFLTLIERANPIPEDERISNIESVL